jgi:hypothetical protein
MHTRRRLLAGEQPLAQPVEESRVSDAESFRCLLRGERAFVRILRDAVRVARDLAPLAQGMNRNAREGAAETAATSLPVDRAGDLRVVQIHRELAH